MSNQWLVYWNWDTVTYELQAPHARLTHAASGQFGKVQPDDILWIVSIPPKSSELPRDLMLVGRMRVALCTSDVYEALRFLGLDDPEELYGATWHACAVREEVEPLRLVNVQDEVEDLRFQSQQDRLTPVDGQVNPQQLQTMRLLTAESAALLELQWTLARELERQITSGELDLRGYDTADRHTDTDGNDDFWDARQRSRADRFTGPLFEDVQVYLRRQLKQAFDDENLAFPEGRPILVEHLKRERNQALVKAAKLAFVEKHGRLFCEACDFDFSAVYGDLGFGYIEAHHTLPVSQLQPNATTRIEDLAMVCANCHRMLHASDPLLNVTELRDVLQRVRETAELEAKWKAEAEEKAQAWLRRQQGK